YRSMSTFTCTFCRLEKPFIYFSRAQLHESIADLHAPLDFSKKRKPLACKSCYEPESPNLKCIICLKSKPLEHFSETQRIYRDLARCMQCKERREKEYMYDSDDSGSHD
ncbi:hypothetical protein K501DRAFT_162826, partial [Backusella circina FSU 941]